MKNSLQIRFLTIVTLLASVFMLSSVVSKAQSGHTPHPRLDSILHRIDSIRIAHIKTLDSIRVADIKRLDSTRIAHIKELDSIRIAKLDSFKAHHPRLDSLKAKREVIDSICKATIHRIDSIRNVEIHKLDSIRFARIHQMDSIIQARLDSIRAHHNGKRIEDIGSATDDNNIPVSISVFPNPIVSSSVVHIENASSSNLVFRMYEINGRLISVKENLGNGNYGLDVNSLASGIYIYEIYDGNSRISTGKLMVQ